MMQNKQLEQEWHFLENLDFWAQVLSLNATGLEIRQQYQSRLQELRRQFGGESTPPLVGFGTDEVLDLGLYIRYYIFLRTQVEKELPAWRETFFSLLGAAAFPNESYREKTAAYYDNRSSFNLKIHFDISDYEESGAVALALIHHLEFANIAPMLRLFIDNYHQRRYPGSNVFFGNVVIWFIDTLRFVIGHVHSEQEKSRFSLLMRLDALMPAGGKQAAMQRDFWLKALSDDTVYLGVEKLAGTLKSNGFQHISCILWDYQRILDVTLKLAAGKKDISGEDIDGLLDKDKERAFLDPTAKRYFDLMQNDEDLDNVADLDSSTKELLRMMREAKQK